MPRPERDRKKGPRLSLFLQVTQPVKIDGGWEVKAISTVLYGSRAPEPPREIIFVADGAEYERVMTDDDSGMATSEIPFQKTGEHLITVYISDFLSVRRYHRFMIKEEQEEPQEGKRSIEILHIFRRVSKLDVLLQRIGKDGKPEQGKISNWDFDKEGNLVFYEPIETRAETFFFVSLPYSDEPRQVTFFLPDDQEVKVTMEVPTKPGLAKEEKKPEKAVKPPLFQRLREAYIAERDKEKVAEVEISRVEMPEIDLNGIDLLRE